MPSVMGSSASPLPPVPAVATATVAVPATIPATTAATTATTEDKVPASHPLSKQAPNLDAEEGEVFLSPNPLLFFSFDNLTNEYETEPGTGEVVVTEWQFLD